MWSLLKKSAAKSARPPHLSVFTTTGKTSISGFSKAIDRLRKTMLDTARKEAEETGGNATAIVIEPCALHDIRRTMATNMARLGVDVVVVERVLNHTMQGVMATYQRYAFLPEKRRRQPMGRLPHQPDGGAGFERHFV